MHTPLRTDLDDAHILKNMAGYLRDLAEDVARVSLAVSDVTSDMAPPPSMTTIQHLQKIDAVQQSLSDLAQLADAIACQEPMRDAGFQGLKLAVTRALLSPDDIPITVHSGSIDIF